LCSFRKFPSVKGLDNFTVKWDISKLTPMAYSLEYEHKVAIFCFLNSPEYINVKF